MKARGDIFKRQRSSKENNGADEYLLIKKGL